MKTVYRTLQLSFDSLSTLLLYLEAKLNNPSKNLHISIIFAGPLTEFGPDAFGYFNVFDRENKGWPDITTVFTALPIVSQWEDKFLQKIVGR